MVAQRPHLHSYTSSASSPFRRALPEHALIMYSLRFLALYFCFIVAVARHSRSSLIAAVSELVLFFARGTLSM